MDRPVFREHREPETRGRRSICLSQLAGILSDAAELFHLGQEKGFLDASRTTAVKQHGNCVQPPLPFRSSEPSLAREVTYTRESSLSPRMATLTLARKVAPAILHLRLSQSLPSPPSLISPHTRPPRVGTSCSLNSAMSPNLRFLVQGLSFGGLQGEVATVPGEQGAGSV